MAISEWNISDWETVVQQGLAVPEGRPLPDLTAELTSMLGDPDPHVRDDLAYATLAAWIGRGEYDDLLAGLGDGMVSGLSSDLGEVEGDAVFRRSFSALVLAACIDRDTLAPTVPDTQILIWGDRLVTWLLGERDLRGYVAGKGWAHALAHGADALGALGASPHLGPEEQQVMLEVLAERLTAPTEELFTAGEPDRCAAAALRILGRDDLVADDLEAWVTQMARSADTAAEAADPTDPAWVTAANVQAFLRALYIQLSLGTPAPSVRADLLLLLVDALRLTNAGYLEPQQAGSGSNLPS